MASERIRIGVTASSLHVEARAASRISRSMGFSGLQFDAVSSALDLTTLSTSGRREFRQVIGAQDQELESLRVDLGAKGLGPGADVDRVINLMDKVMETAAGLGSTLVCVEIGPLPAVTAAEPPKPAVTPLQAGLLILPESMTRPQPESPVPPPAPADPHFVSQVHAALVELGQHADRYSVMLAFRSELASLASLEAVLRETACPWFGVDLDPVAVLRDPWDLDGTFSRLGHFISHVRARDAVGGADRRTKPAGVGQGSVPWDTFIGNLLQSDYQGWMAIDPVDLSNRSDAAASGFKYLSNIRG